MTQISRRPLNKEVEKRMNELFTLAISNLRTSEDVKSFLDDLLSPIEKVMIAKRLSIALLLSEGYTYPEIGRILNVTPPTIASVSLNLKYKGNGYKSVLQKIIKQEKNRDLIARIESIVESIPPPKGFNPDYIRENLEKSKLKRKPF